MSARLILRIDADGEPRDWLIDDERRRSSVDPVVGVPTPARLNHVDQVVVLAPAEYFLCAEIELAAKRREQLSKALPFALEDLLLDPVEKLHFGAAPTSGSRHLAAAVRRDRLESWLQALQAHAIRPDALLPDAAALPLIEGRASMLVDGQRYLVAAAAGRQLALDGESLAAVLDRLDLPRDSDGSMTICVFGDAAHFALPAGVRIERDPRHAHPLSVLAAGLRSRPWPNLLVDAYAPAHRGADARRAWRIAAWCAGLALFGALASLVGEQWLLSRRLADLNREMTRVFQAAFPQQTRIVDPAGQMHGEYKKIVGGAARVDALSITARIAPLLMQSTQYTVKAMEFRNGTLEVTVLAGQVAALDKLREMAASLPGVSAKLSSATTSELGAEGRLQIAEQPK